MSKPMNIEQLKNIAIVVLFLSTILLLSFFWGDISFDRDKMLPSTPEAEVPLVQEVLQPYRIILNFGVENSTIIPSDTGEIWYNKDFEKSSIVREIHNFGQAENLLLREITGEQYKEAMSYRSIRAEFNYYITFSEFCRKYEINTPQSYNGIETISEIGYSEQSADSLLLYDGKNNKYYILIADADYTQFKALIKSIEDKGYENYYSLNTLLGVGGEDLIPLNPSTKIKTFSYQQEAYVHQTDKINEIAQSFFGDSFDFVRKITEESGTIIYMYGYGQKVVIANPDGSFEYREEQLSHNNAQQSFFASLDTALAFVASHGSWESFDGSKMVPCLKMVMVDPDKKKGFRFIFGMEVAGSRLYYETGDAIVVDVTWGQVTYYKRNMISYDENELAMIENSAEEPAFSPINLIAQNYEYIYSLLPEKEIKDSDVGKKENSLAFEMVAKSIKDMEMGYLRRGATQEEGYEILPVWIVSLDGIKLYFDLFTAEPLGDTPRQGGR